MSLNLTRAIRGRGREARRLIVDQVHASSNLVDPAYCLNARRGRAEAGARLLNEQTQVRFLPPALGVGSRQDACPRRRSKLDGEAQPLKRERRVLSPYGRIGNLKSQISNLKFEI